MKRLLLVLCCMAALMPLTAQAQAVIKFDKTSHDFGKFKESAPQTYSFVFTNTGDQPLVIQQAFASCGCTVPTFSKEPVQPGEKGKITVTYNGKGKFPGHFKKPGTERSNASNQIVRIYVEGDMVSEQ